MISGDRQTKRDLLSRGNCPLAHPSAATCGHRCRLRAGCQLNGCWASWCMFNNTTI